MNLKFTINTFENCVSYFLDTKTCPNGGLGICHKHTQTWQYVNFDSLTLRKRKVSWSWSLVTRAKWIYSKKDLNKEIQLIKNYAAWNGYPNNIVNLIVKRALRDKESNNITEESTTDTVKIFIDLKFSGNRADRIVKNCIKKLYKYFK